MASEFTPKQLNITPALGREKAEARLTVYGDRPENFAIKQSWYLVQHADVTGRMNGEAAIAYRRLSGYQLAKLVCEIANENIMGADVITRMYKFMGISLEVAPVTETTKTPLTWEQAQELLADNPNRLDVFLPYANSARVVTSINRHIDGYWNVIAGGWQMAFDGDNIAYTHNIATEPAAPDTASAEAGETAQVESKYSDYVRERTWKEAREFHKNTGAEMSMFYADCARSWEDMSDAAIDEWLQYERQDNESSRRARNFVADVAYEMLPTPDPATPQPVASEPSPAARAKAGFTGNSYREEIDGKEYAITRNFYGAYNITFPGDTWTVDGLEAAFTAFEEAVTGSNPVIQTTDGYDNIVILNTPAVKITELGVPVGMVNPRYIDRLGDAVIQTGKTTRFYGDNELQQDAMEWSWLFAGTEHKPNGHSRPSRNRKNSRQTKAQGSRKVSFTMNGANVEKNTVKSQSWRNKRNLANAVAMPVPTITGRELLQTAQQLTLLPQARKPMTRVLEGKRVA